MNRSKKNGRTIGAMALIASMIPVVLTAQARETGVDKTTWLYAVKGTDSLYMDRYVAEASRETNAPCLIFAFGGGFVGGERDNPAYVPYFEYFARKGYAVVSIDYRLGLRETAGSRPDLADTPEALAERFFAAVDMAVEDLYDATSFIVGQARAWGLDPSAVVASGSSAGAITVLQGLGAEPPPARRLPLCRHHRLRRSRFGEKLLRSGLAGKARPDPAISRRCGL